MEKLKSKWEKKTQENCAWKTIQCKQNQAYTYTYIESIKVYVHIEYSM